MTVPVGAVEPTSAIRVFGPLGTGAYTPIIAPYDCDYYEIIQTSDGSGLRRSSDGTDGNSYQMVAGAWYSVNITPRPYRPIPPSNRRFLAGQPVTYLKALVGTPTVVVEFLQ